MDFSFTPDQTLLKNSARAFLDEHCKPAAVRMLWNDARGESEATWKEMAQLGWLGLALPEAHGGSDLGIRHQLHLDLPLRGRRTAKEQHEKACRNPSHSQWITSPSTASSKSR